MYQRFPSSGGKPAALEQPPAPRPVQNAVKLMYVGAAVSTVSLVLSLVDIGSIKSAVKKDDPTLTAAQVSSESRFIIALAVVSGLVGIALWLWMARANGNGRNWARIVSTILFCLATLDMVGVITEPKTVLSLIFPVLTWLVGLAAIFYLWRGESSEFFKPKQYV